MLNILHLDHSEFFRKIIRDIIENCGHSAVSVATISEAKDALRDFPFDLVLTSLELKDGSVKSLFKIINHGGSREIPVIVITSTDSITVREQLFSLGVVDYLLKSEIDVQRMKRYFDTLAARDELSRFMRNLRVAVLDDSKIILRIVSTILHLNSFTSVTLFEAPLDLLASPESFDIYLTDIVLPGMTGEQVVVKLRERGSNAIIIAMSQFATDKPLSSILLAGANDYIQKPFDAVALISRLKVNVLSFQLKQRLEAAAITDGLTGLYNHRHSLDRLDDEIKKAKRYKRELSVIMLDIDNFKKINDTRGHQGGDLVLASVAGVLKSAVRKGDLAGRYGGEEFLIVLTETDVGSARIAAEKLRSAIERLETDTDGKAGVTVSLGVAGLIPGDESGSLVNRADEFLYAAKKSGKNRVEG